MSGLTERSLCAEPPIGSIVRDDEGCQFRHEQGGWFDDLGVWTAGRTWLGVLLTGRRLSVVRWGSSSGTAGQGTAWQVIQ